MGTLVIYDLLVNRYEVQPDQLATAMVFIAVPWAPKIFYGIIIDTFPICGSTKKSYLILLGSLFCLSGFSAGLIDFKSYHPLVALMTVT